MKFYYVNMPDRLTALKRAREAREITKTEYSSVWLEPDRTWSCAVWDLDGRPGGSFPKPAVPESAPVYIGLELDRVIAHVIENPHITCNVEPLRERTRGKGRSIPVVDEHTGLLETGRDWAKAAIVVGFLVFAVLALYWIGLWNP